MRALVLGASGGIGAALTTALRARGDSVTALSRQDDGLRIEEAGSLDALLSGVGEVDLAIVATGILAPEGAAPEKALAQVEAESMARLFAVNAIGPALALARIAPLLPKGARSVVAVLTARVGSITDNGLGGWHGYRASKAAANMVLRGASVELARSHPQAICVALHPGTVETPFTRAYAGRHPMIPAEEAARDLLALIDRLTPEQSGGFFDRHGAAIPW
ncbi:SDR family NAD(P)-dependent oxidoreductase [Pseudoroseicyclus aestuarii]|uniref:Short-subunit dehydrogenase n=1 Tax=Pseudoroseicyclus aestuarii TaxID=1795041 RepID=A0A318SPG3_9RHOB|nr:SDR family NAD(P)-dependent oxidoreductase [Pseudoroseicyclus aestuarii]PYE83760.1 short-subunit dehydrogenase [Pseudoroseicyclus aestuarii]